MSHLPVPSTSPSTSRARTLTAGSSDERSGLLRPSYRKRRVSHSVVVETHKQRKWTGIWGGILAIAFLALAIVYYFSHLTFPGSDTSPGYNGPLPPPQPGLRNPSYLATGYEGAVAAEVDVCSEIGVGVLRDGGTATDAGIAAALCVGVVNCFSSGVGGGGFLTIKPGASAPPSCRDPITIDFRETAPAAAFPKMFTKRKDDPQFDPDRASKIGGLAVGVPGELRGFEEAYKRCGGGVSWKRIFEPSIKLARGHTVGREMARRLHLLDVMWMFEDRAWSDIFVRDGRFLQQGEVLRRPQYAATLETVAKYGASAFYTGPIAHSIISAVQRRGGILTADDLESYTALVKPALVGTYLNRTVYTSQAPTSGPVLLSLLNTLEGYAPEFARSGQRGLGVHRFVEALKFAFASRSRLGDPDFAPDLVFFRRLPTKDYAAEIRANITDEKTHPFEYYLPQFEIEDDHGTTHISAMDADGSAIGITTTVNLIFGSQVLDAGTGVILNDEMDDFATPGIPDAFGLEPSPLNFPEPGKRPLSSTAPTVIDHAFSNSTFAVLGGSGGSRIFGSVAQVLLNLDWGHDVASAIELPRVHDQLIPSYVSAESGYRPDLLDELRSRGHNVSLFDVNVGMSQVQAVTRGLDGRFAASSDSRKNGVPAAF